MKAIPALDDLVRDILDTPATVAVHQEKMKSGVHRLWCMVDGERRSFVAKRLDPNIARRNELVARRWLPAVGLEEVGPPLLAVAAETDGSRVWHLYGDLGDASLDTTRADARLIERAVAAIARIHTSFAGHRLIPECRLWGGDLGIYFYAASVRDAIASLEFARAQGSSGELVSLCERLLARLEGLADEQDRRAAALGRHGGPETLLHGDLWPMNVMIYPNGRDLHTRLIDWDHAAVGPIAYDLSTFLSRFPLRDRLAVLRIYEERVSREGWSLPPATELNRLFETAELARIANRVVWPALAICDEGAGWAWDELAEVERWFERLEPILPLGDACGQS
jgi:Phosphotransferase enzyme family